MQKHYTEDLLDLLELDAKTLYQRPTEKEIAN
jgi:hypothetical protein